MEKHRFKLCPKDKKAFEVELKDDEDAKHILVRLSDGAFCDTLNTVLINELEAKEEVIEATTFRQLDLQNYHSVSLSGNFTDPKGFVEGDVYIGNWEEIVLTEVELSFSDAPFYYTCDLERIDFTVGAEGESQMHAEAIDDGFSVSCTIFDESKKTFKAQRSFLETSDGAQIIKRLYGRLKGRAKGEGFQERQEGQKSKLTEQFNKTIAESFRR